MYYLPDVAETATTGAKLKTNDGGLVFFSVGETSYVSEKYLKPGLNIIELEPNVTQLEMYSDSAKKSIVVFGSLDIITGINPKLDYRIFPDGNGIYSTNKDAKLNQLLADIRNLGVAKDFYYNVPIQRSNEIDLNAAIDTELLSSPLTWYDPNNVNRKFVVSEIESNYLATGITLTKASRV